MRSTKLIIDKKAIEHNIKEIKKYIGDKVSIMLVAKSFGYGSFINEISSILNEFNYVAVAYLDEAIELRKKGYKNNILILYPLSKYEYETSKEYDFILNGSNIFELINDNTPTKIHIEIETGMGRTGILLKDLNEYINNLNNNNNIYVDGIFTHLSSPSNYMFSIEQINKFKSALDLFKENNINIENVHVLSSGGLKYYKDYIYNMVRIGLLIYGYYPNDSLKTEIKLMPCMKFKTNISYLKTIDPGSTVGYNQNFIAQKETKVATLPLGFADGLLTLETGEAYVIINNQKAYIIGICMDNMMIDVTDIQDVKVGDEVYIWDNKLLTVEQLGNWCNGICNYEIISSISTRVRRVIE